MPEFRVRYTIDKWIDVEAADEEAAKETAQAMDESEWGQVTGRFEVESIDDESPCILF